MADTARILVVDDEPDTVGLLELTLSTAGYEIQSARSGQEGLRLALEKPFDLLLLDVMMPDLTGFDLMRSLQELHGVSERAPVVILTARDRPEDREIGERLGAVGYLIKPATRGQLVDAIRQALASPAARGDPA
jgi:DNA-binding response OmpR family regulator